MFNEQRSSPRKILKARAIVTFDGAAPIATRTVDVGANGLCLSNPDPMPAGQECQLNFEVFVDGKVNTIKTRSKSLYCIFSGGDYKVGFRFLSLELAAMTLLAKYMR